MSDVEQGEMAAAMATVLDETPIAAPLVRAREALMAAQAEDQVMGAQQTSLKGERERLRSQWHGAQQAEQGSLDERIAQDARDLRPRLEQQALAADPQRVPSWRL